MMQCIVKTEKVIRDVDVYENVNAIKRFINQEGYEIVDFNFPKDGQEYFTVWGEYTIVKATIDHGSNSNDLPRYIIRKLQRKSLASLMIDANVGKVYKLEHWLGGNCIGKDTVRLIKVKDSSKDFVIHAVDAKNGTWYSDLAGLSRCDVRVVEEIK